MSCFWEGFLICFVAIGGAILVVAWVFFGVFLGDKLSERTGWDEALCQGICIFGPIVLILPFVMGILMCR